MSLQLSTQLMTFSALMVLIQGPVSPDREPSDLQVSKLTYRIADTGQDRCFGESAEIAFPKRGKDWHGQDAQYRTQGPRYRDNGDGTISDLVTGLMWEKTPDFVKRDQDASERHAKGLKLARHKDWRLPTMKELFSIADFRGNMRTRTPYIDTEVFDFVYPDSSVGERGQPGMRNMDAQYATSTRYLGITMGRDESAFGFNFADGRIKSYPLRAERYVRCVRGNPSYGKNRFKENGDGTISDLATGLIWQKADSGKTMDWKQSLAYAAGLEVAGKSDWRLPDVKELQSLVDYDRAPDASDASKRGPALDPIFGLTKTESWFWSSTTHIENAGAYYVCFGQSFSTRRQGGRQINAHGAGAVRSDPKTGDPSRWSEGRGPQGDEVRIQNYVRCVRGGGVKLLSKGPKVLGGSPPSNEGPGMERRGPPQGRSPYLERFDKNKDGKISQGEFAGPERRFDRMDRDGDGYLQADEVPNPRNRNQPSNERGERRRQPGSETAGRSRQGTGNAGRQRSTIQLGTGLEVVTVGTGSPIYNPERSRPCTMISFGGKLILVDLGEGTTDLLDKNGIQLRRVAGVCFTHHHRDHNADAMSLLPKLWQMGNAAPIVGPKGTSDLVGFLRSFYSEDLDYRTRKSGTQVPSLDHITVQDLPAAVPALIPGLKITTTEVPHTITTYAYRFDAGDRSIVVSGDLSFSTALIELAKNADILVIDSGGIAYVGEQARPQRANRGKTTRQGQHRAHAGMDEIAHMAADAGVTKLVLVHFRKGKVDEKATLAAMSKIYKGEIVFAHDMQVIQ